LAQKYGYTPDEIADLSPKRQQMLCGVVDNTMTFNTAREYEEWMLHKGK